MSERAAKKVAWTCWTLTVGFLAGELLIGYLNAPSTVVGSIFSALLLVAFATVGLLIASRQHENLTGWVVVTGTLLTAIADFALEYAVYGAVTAPGSVPTPLWAGTFGGWFRSVGFILITYTVLLVFPDGRLPTRRWRIAAWILVASGVVQSADAFFSPDFSDIEFRLSSFVKPTGNIVPPVVSGIFGGLTLLLWGASVFTCVAAIVVRFRRSRGDERQQIKWLTYSALLSGTILVLIYASVALNLDYMNTIGGLLFDLALAPIPIAVGIAILKYRLYDIDIIVNRTLVYGSLTAMLALIYWGGVAGLQVLLRPLVGEGNDLAIVATTLAVAALFLPLQRAVQRFIDRRFYRRKYDAARTLEAFSTTLRDEVDLAALSGRVVGVIEETMQPAHVSLWLHEPRQVKG